MQIEIRYYAHYKEFKDTVEVETVEELISKLKVFLEDGPITGLGLGKYNLVPPDNLYLPNFEEEK